MDKQVSIGRVKREISEIVNRVAFGGERIILVSRGKPKAALVSIEDYKKLQAIQTPDIERWEQWLHQAGELAADILKERGGRMIDVDALLAQDRADLEARDDWIVHRN
jgi:prevent-host-death family protein